MMYPPDMDIETRRSVFQRKLVCFYILCSANTYAARAERHNENRVLSNYILALTMTRESNILPQDSIRRSLGRT